MTAEQAEQSAVKAVEYDTARIRSDLNKMARVISGHRNESMQEVIDRHLRPSLLKEFREVVEEMAELGSPVA